MKTLFWNVDTQYDFMRNDDSYNGKLPILGARAIEGNLARLTSLARENNIVVVNTADWHNEKTEEISKNPDFINTFPEHCMQNTFGAEFVKATNPENPYVVDWQQKQFDKERILQSRNILLYKDKFDIFLGNSHASEIIGLLKPERIIIYGVATNVCLDFAVKGLLARKFPVYVPFDSIKELPNLDLPYEAWKKGGAIFTTTDEVYKMVGGRK
jgi:nicotinamidase/pyrazinamidase